MMNGEFASSPAFFDDGVDENWMTETIGKVFPNFQSVEGMDRILRISLASLVHNREKVMAFDANHIARSIPIFQDLSTIETVFDKIKIVRAWDSICGDWCASTHQRAHGFGGFAKRAIGAHG
jgi:hypothetical protein